MRPNITVTMGQQLGMTQQLAQSIRLLQLSSLELSAELRQALDDNPLLEAEEEGTVAAVDDFSEGVDQDFAGPSGGARRDDFDGSDDYADHLVAQQDVHMRILEQAMLIFDDPAERNLACEICAATDDAGYLSDALEDILARTETEGMDLVQAESVLARIQRLEPVAYAARSLKECLLVQLDEMAQESQDAALMLAQRIVATHLDDVAAHRWTALATRLATTVDEVLHAVGVIRGLDAKPAATRMQTQYITPDVRVERSVNGWSVRLNDSAIPRLRVNPMYARAVESDKTAKALRTQLQEARWLLRSVQVRQNTLLAATEAIFQRQAAFLSRGEVGLSPLTLKDIAEEIGVHESTLSRITSSKYVQTPRGTYSLKHFFPSQLQTAEGVNASGASVKALIRRLVDAEPVDAPLRDVDIADILARRGISIARRTIAKYREALGIRSSKERMAARKMHARPAPLNRGLRSGQAGCRPAA